MQELSLSYAYSLHLPIFLNYINFNGSKQLSGIREVYDLK